MEAELPESVAQQQSYRLAPVAAPLRVALSDPDLQLR